MFSALLPDTFGSPQAAFWIGAIATVLLTSLYTVFGGLRAVLFTDAAQASILLIGSICITFIGLKQLGGWEELRVMAKVNAGAFALWRPIDDPNFPWLGILIGSPIVGIGYWCTDQNDRASDPERVRGLTWGSRSEADVREIRESWSAVDVVMTVAILGLVLSIYFYFTFWLSY